LYIQLFAFLLFLLYQKNYYSMKFILLYIVVFFNILGCKSTSEKNGNLSDSVVSKEKPINKYFFDYDAIDYYKTDISISEILEMFNKEQSTELDEIKHGILVGHFPESLNDDTFFKVLGLLDYKKSKVDRSKFESINDIFREKLVESRIDTSCMPLYADILIFSKNQKVVGIAKLCFGCHHFVIIGTSAFTENFGQDGDFDRLDKILSK
jgi:hypothetical protein